MPESLLHQLLKPEIIVLSIPIVAILAGAIIKITKMMIVHHERITMIQHGIHPDYPPDVEIDQNDSKLS
jgi:hypothetical protein